MNHQPGWRTAALGLVVTAMLALGVPWAGGPVAAGPGPGSARAQGVPAITLLDQPGWVRPGEPFTTRVRVDHPPPGATVDMIVHARLEARSDLRASLDGELGATEHEVDPVPVTGPTVAVGFTPSTDAGGLSGRGPYPVEVRLRSADGEIRERLVTFLSYLTETPDDWPALDVAVIVDIGAPPALRTDGATSLSAESVALARQRVEAVEAASGVPVALAPLPETVEGIARAGPEAEALVTRLRDLAADHQVLARPFVDVDLASLHEAGLDGEANAQSEAGADVARSRLRVEPVGGLWLSGPALGAASARRAATLGFGTAVVPATAVDVGDDLPTHPVRLGDGGPLALVSDPRLEGALTSRDGVVAVHRFIAELTVAWLEAPSLHRAVAVRVPADVEIDPRIVGAALGALREGQVARAVPVTQVFADVTAPEDGNAAVDLAPAGPSPDLRSLTGRVASLRGRIGGVENLVGESGAAPVDHLALMSTGLATPDGERTAYVDAAEHALGDLTGAVTLPPEFRITLTSRSSTIPVNVQNSTAQELKVRIELDSDQLEFPDGSVLTPTLPAEATTHLDVRVRTRTSGAFTLDVSVTSPDGSLVLDQSVFDVRSTTISGVGVLLSAGSALFLAVWWARNWRRARRAGGGPAPTDGSAAGPAGRPAPAPPCPPEAPMPAGPRRAATGTVAPWAAAARGAPPGAAPPPPAPGDGPPRPAPEAPTGAPADPERDVQDGRRRRRRHVEPYRPAHMARPRGRRG